MQVGTTPVLLGMLHSLGFLVERAVQVSPIVIVSALSTRALVLRRIYPSGAHVYVDFVYIDHITTVIALLYVRYACIMCSKASGIEGVVFSCT